MTDTGKPAEPEGRGGRNGSGGGGTGGEGLALPPGLRATPDDARAGGHYVYAAGECLCVEEDLPLIADRLEELGLTRPEAEIERDRELAAVGVVRYLVPDDGRDYVDMLDRLRSHVELGVDGRSGQRRTATPRVAPNHAVSFDWHHSYHSAFNRRPAPPLPALAPAAAPAGGLLEGWREQPLPGTGCTVGIVDTGVASQSAGWFGGRVEHGPDDEDQLSSPLHTNDGHGTFVAGLVARYAPGARILVRRPAGTTDDFVLDSDLAAAIRELAVQGVDIIGVSAGGFTHDNAGLLATGMAVEEVWRKHPEIVVVASAGNDATSLRRFPAADGRVIGVASCGDHDQRSPFSNHGSWVDAAAPGEDAHSVFVRGSDAADPAQEFRGFARWTGTSFSVPLVVAAIAVEFRPGGWRAKAKSVRSRLPGSQETARQVAWRMLNDPKRHRVAGIGTIFRPEPYVS